MTAPLMPDLVDRDPAPILADLIAQFEATMGRTLQPAQIERLLLDLIAYQKSIVLMAVQDTAMQNLVAFARAPMLDFLGQLVGVTRLAAAPATATLTFTLAAVQAVDVAVPAGTRVQTSDGKVVFATADALVIPAGAASGDTLAAAAVAGITGNGYVAGTVTAILDPVAFVQSATNAATTDNGADIESDDRLRDRIRQAPSQFSVAGSTQAYRFFAMSASSAIADVAVTSPVPGSVRLHVLAVDGLPDEALIDAVVAAVTDEKVRPLTDTVEVVAPTVIGYTIVATVRLLTGVDIDATQAAVHAAAAAFAAERSALLGRDIVPSQVIAALGVPGVYDVALTAPAALVVVAPEDWASCTDITITFGVSADG